MDSENVERNLIDSVEAHFCRITMDMMLLVKETKYRSATAAEIFSGLNKLQSDFTEWRILRESFCERQAKNAKETQEQSNDRDAAVLPQQ